VAVAMTAVENRVAVDSGDNIILRVKFFTKFNKRLQHLGGSAWSGRHFRFEDQDFLQDFKIFFKSPRREERAH
jgi:hypothetical protein